MQEFADIQAAEVFRKRQEHRRKKHKQTPTQKEDKPIAKLDLQLKATTGLEFVEVATKDEIEETDKSSFDQEISDLQKKVNMTSNEQSNAAIQAAISFLQKSKGEAGSTDASAPVSEAALNSADHKGKDAENWGIYTFFFDNDSCDYETSTSLDEGQKYYRSRTNDTAKLFIANGLVQRQKGDQLSIEICTGKALMQGKLKMKTYDKEKLYVVNHEGGTIYNDIVKFNSDRMDDAVKNYDSYGDKDSTFILRGSDGLILRKKGDEDYIAQSLAYLYNDSESDGHLQQQAYSQVMAQSDA